MHSSENKTNDVNGHICSSATGRTRSSSRSMNNQEAVQDQRDSIDWTVSIVEKQVSERRLVSQTM